MKFLFVVGGSYKGFYLNQINKIRNVDLIVFQQNIIYTFDYYEEFCGNKLVSRELLSLNKKFNCPIIAFGKYSFLAEIKKCFIVCVNEKISVLPVDKDVKLYINGKLILISNKLSKIFKSNNYFSTILLIDKKAKINSNNLLKNVFVCDNNSVTRCQGGQFYKKFRKYCYFSLCFHKKMI